MNAASHANLDQLKVNEDAALDRYIQRVRMTGINIGAMVGGVAGLIVGYMI